MPMPAPLDLACLAAEAAAKASVKLQEMQELLEQLALRRVREGDDASAREVLKVGADGWCPSCTA